MVLVTHDMTALKSLCERGLLLDRGSPVVSGTAEEAANGYLALVAERLATGKQAQITIKNGSVKRHGTGEGQISRFEILHSDGRQTDTVQFGEETTFRFHLHFMMDVPESGVGFYIRDRFGNDLIGINTFEEGRTLGPRRKGDTVIVEFRLPLFLREGSYSISPGFAYNPTDPRYLDWIDNAA